MRGRVLALGVAAIGVAAILAAGVVLAGGSGEEAAPSRSTGSTAALEPAGPAAPELSGTDPVTGQRVSLADFRGKPVVLNVWASWCAECEDEAPDLARLAREHPEAVVLGLDYEDTVGDAKAFYEKHGWKHPSIFDPRGELTAKLGLAGLPTTFFLSRSHRIVSNLDGAGTLELFEQGLARAKKA